VPASWTDNSNDPAAYVEAVLALVERIPAGRVMSYGAIADFLHEAYGRGSARRVGTIMAQYGGTVPWYRVVNSAGRTPPGHEAKARRLLEAEGVTFTAAGRVHMPTHSWWPANTPPPGTPHPPTPAARATPDARSRRSRA
jgi:methylated-DNA-protein-cysteine methyltransferase-like protein